MSQPHILMCPPDFFGIEYEINPWMSRQRQSDRPTAIRAVECIAAVVGGSRGKGFAADAGLRFARYGVHRQCGADLSADGGDGPISGIRSGRGKCLTTRRGWRRRGFRIEHVPEDIHFEGAGDALFCGDTLFAGYRIRSHARGHQQIGELLGCRVIPMELVDPYYYHLDTCFCPLAPGMAIYFPPAVDQYGRDALAANIPDLIAVEPEEARRFACNAVVVGTTVVTNTGCPQLHAALRARGFDAARNAARRIRQSRRQREVSYAAARRRRSRGLEKRIGSVDGRQAAGIRADRRITSGFRSAALANASG